MLGGCCLSRKVAIKARKCLSNTLNGLQCINTTDVWLQATKLFNEFFDTSTWIATHDIESSSETL